jgi:hypothetical protein
MFDDMLFGNVRCSEFVDADMASRFKEAFTTRLNLIDVDDVIMSPFEGEVYEACSKPSFVLTESKSHKECVVRVEVPHFEHCERIPLRPSPLICSFNETIDFMRDGESGDKIGKFNLYRLKFNVLWGHLDEDGNIEEEERITADFIDVCVPAQDDAELLAFWESGRCVSVWDADVGFYVCVPDRETCIEELERILYEYESVDSKREKRERKLTALKAASN